MLLAAHVFVVIEGEIAYYFPFIPHAVFSQRSSAEAYATALARSNGVQRWANIAIVEFEVDKPGHIEHRTVTLQ